MEDQQTWEGDSNGDGNRSGKGYGNGNGGGSGNGSGRGYGGGDGDGYGRVNGNGSGDGNGNLYRLFPIPEEYYYLLKDQTPPQRVKICYDLHNASSQEAVDILVEWYEAVQIDKAT